MIEEQLYAVPGMSGDERVRVFRRVFDAAGEFEGMEVDAYVVITDRCVVVLDTMLGPADVSVMMQAVQSELEGRAVLCVDSHADWDHAWGNAYFTGIHAAPIIGHEHCRTRLQSAEARAELAEFQQRYSIFSDVRLVPPTITFSERLAIQGGDLTIDLLTAPGHHLDQIVAWIPELRLLLAFDAVERPLPIIDGVEGVPHMFRTLGRLIELQPERVLCSHGNATSPQLVKENLAYLREIERRGQSLLQRHRPTDEELEQSSLLLAYSFDEVIADSSEKVDSTFYSGAHENNVQVILRWLMGV